MTNAQIDKWARKCNKAMISFLLIYSICLSGDVVKMFNILPVLLPVEILQL